MAASRNLRLFCLGVILLSLGLGLTLRLTNQGLLPPFVDETAGFFAADSYADHSSLERLLFGKYLGYLVQKPLVYLSVDPLAAARVLSALLGTLGAALVTYAMLLWAGPTSAAASSVILGLSPQLIFHDRMALHESIAFAFSACALVAVVLARRREDPGILWWFVAGVAFACAVFTKIYAGTLFPLLALAAWRGPVLPSPSWGMASVGFAFGGVLAAGLIVLSAVDPSWQSMHSPADLFHVARTIVGAGKSSYGERIWEAFGFFSTYGGGFFLAAAVASIQPVRRFWKAPGNLALAVTLVGIFAFAKVFASFNASRYYNLLMIPLAVGIGFAFAPSAGEVISRPRRFLSWLCGALVAACAVQSTVASARFLVDPAAANVPERDRDQYLDGWSSGRYLDGLALYLRGRELRGSRGLAVFTLGGFRHGKCTLPLLLRDRPQINFLSSWAGNDYALKLLPEILHTKTVLMVVEPVGWPVDYQRLLSAGFKAEQVYTSPSFPDSTVYKVLEISFP